MDAGAVIVAKPVRRADAGGGSVEAGYLYLVLHTQQLPEGRWDVLRSSFARPALGAVLAVVALTTLLAVLIIAAVTRPLRQLTQAVSTLSQRGLAEGLAVAPGSALPAPTKDEFGQLTSAFEMLLDICRRQWNALRRTDHFRREGVSNLSHDLRSPLTATVACLETLDGRWGASAERAEDRRLVEIALRNTRNAARMVQSLGDLAKLDEPEFTLRREVVDAGELLDDIAVRFAERPAAGGRAAHRGAAGRRRRAARRGRRRAVRARDRKPGRQRPQVLRARRHRHARRRGARRPRRGQRRRRRPGIRRPTCRALRPLLPEPADGRAGDGGRRPRPRPGDRQADRRAARRRRRRREHARPRHARRHHAAGGGVGAARRAGARLTAVHRETPEHDVGALRYSAGSAEAPAWCRGARIDEETRARSARSRPKAEAKHEGAPDRCPFFMAVLFRADEAPAAGQSVVPIRFSRISKMRTRRSLRRRRPPARHMVQRKVRIACPVEQHGVRARRATKARYAGRGRLATWAGSARRGSASRICARPLGGNAALAMGSLPCGLRAFGPSHARQVETGVFSTSTSPPSPTCWFGSSLVLAADEVDFNAREPAHQLRHGARRGGAEDGELGDVRPARPGPERPAGDHLSSARARSRR
jgi:hypothetical protein